jgi:hypothetical protein
MIYRHVSSCLVERWYALFQDYWFVIVVFFTFNYCLNVPRKITNIISKTLISLVIIYVSGVWTVIKRDEVKIDNGKGKY